MVGVNSFTLKNIYPSSTGATVGAEATGAAGGSAASRSASEMPSPVDRAVSIGLSGNVVMSGLILVGLVWGVTFLAERYGGSERSIKGTLFNVLVIGLIAAVGTPIWKYLATRFPIPGASAWILAG